MNVEFGIFCCLCSNGTPTNYDPHRPAILFDQTKGAFSSFVVPTNCSIFCSLLLFFIIIRNSLVEIITRALYLSLCLSPLPISLRFPCRCCWVECFADKQFAIRSPQHSLLCWELEERMSSTQAPPPSPPLSPALSLPPHLVSLPWRNRSNRREQWISSRWEASWPLMAAGTTSPPPLSNP